MKFTGKERDQESGLDYFGARYYGSALGRFLSPDEPLADQHPEDPQSWNLYSYGRNNPLSGIDPNGQNWFTDFFQGLTNCFRYDSCHTTEHIAQQRQSDFLNSLVGPDGKPLTANQKEDLQSKMFGGLKPSDTIKAVDYYNQNLQHVQQRDNSVAPPMGAPQGVPPNVQNTLNQVDSTGSAPNGQLGGRQFMNDGRSAGQSLPKTDASGNPIQYREWDVNPKVPGVNRGGERLVTGSDGSAYYTADHYQTFTRIR